MRKVDEGINEVEVRCRVNWPGWGGKLTLGRFIRMVAAFIIMAAQEIRNSCLRKVNGRWRWW